MATPLAARVALAADRARDLDVPPISAPTARKWDIVSAPYSVVARWLDDGWEPFAVVQRKPSSDRTTTEATVYLRREHVHEAASAL